jgi:hypothetical protein
MASYLGMVRKTVWTVDEKEFEGLLKEGFGFSLRYFFLIFVFSTLVYLAVQSLLAISLVVGLFAAVYFSLPYAIGIGLILPLVSHALVILLGGRRPLTDTFQMYFYASTPSLLLNWVPCLGSLAPLISFGNVFRGIKQINGFPFWKAAVAVLLPALAYWGLWLYLTFLLLSASKSV